MASLAGLGDAQLARFRAKATPQPFRTFTQALRLGNPLPATYRRVGILCTESLLTIAKLRDLIAAGDPRFHAYAAPDWTFHELPTGHWPMLSTPDALADLLHQLSQT
jgi:hypothetical protein